ncbi:hypothetical protein [Enterobacter mori]|uniref:hypothetical protein n=1 Tax=Enterobacter mori TaxID=539813 RepID=UPI001B8B758F|nr:hypothetical protein [Enterobacter mori]MBS3050484.1 hypothetical protein [Enterobacter mori]
MDIFEQICAELGIEGVRFNHDNIAYCELMCNEEKLPLRCLLYRNYEEMSINVAVRTRNALPENITPDFLTLLAENAIEPFRGGYGVGLLPGSESRELVVYKCIMLSGYQSGEIKTHFAGLINIAEQWDEKLVSVSGI